MEIDLLCSKFNFMATDDNYKILIILENGKESAGIIMKNNKMVISNIFCDWREAVLYMRWCIEHNEFLSDRSYKKWFKIYNLIPVKNFNEFNQHEIVTSIGVIRDIDLNTYTSFQLYNNLETKEEEDDEDFEPSNKIIDYFDNAEEDEDFDEITPDELSYLGVKEEVPVDFDISMMMMNIKI